MMLCLKMGSLKNIKVVPHSQVTSSSYLVHDHNVLDYFGLFHHVFMLRCFPASSSTAAYAVAASSDVCRDI